MNKDNVIQQLKRILVDDLFVAVPIDEIKETDSISNDLGLDSVGFVELGTLVSENFQVPVDDAALTEGSFATLETIYQYIVSKSAAAA